MIHWFVLAVNPDPWAIGPVGTGRRNGKLYSYVGRNNQLYDYQQAVKEEMREVEMLPKGTYKLTFYFWRALDSHASGKKHAADATNLQKGLEDALQGVLFDNDRDVHDVRSVIVDQTSTAKPCIIIKAESFNGLDPHEIPDHVWEQVDHTEPEPLFDSNVWGGPEA